MRRMLLIEKEKSSVSSIRDDYTGWPVAA
jgi:hypothetical protein